MNEKFEYARIFTSDCYVADFTKQTQSQRGVELSESPFEDIHSFHLSNPNQIEYWGVNFEEHQSFFKDPGSVDVVSQCECMFVSKNARKKGWVCLVELKYCEEHNIERNSDKAYDQLVVTLDFLLKKNVLSLRDHRFYLNISVPDHSNKEPFSSFQNTQDRLLSLKKRGVFLLGYNNVLIFNEAFIKVPKVEV